MGRHALLHARLGADADLEEVPDGVHGLDEPRLRRLERPEVRLRVRLREDAWRADEIPCGQREARVAMVLLRRDVLRVSKEQVGKQGGLGSAQGGRKRTEKTTNVVMYRQRGVLRAPHLAVLVALAQPVRAGRVSELRRLREQLRGVLVVDEEDVVDAALVEERELVQRVRELGRRVLGGALEVLDALLRALRQPQLAVELCDP